MVTNRLTLMTVLMKNLRLQLACSGVALLIGAFLCFIAFRSVERTTAEFHIRNLACDLALALADLDYDNDCKRLYSLSSESTRNTEDGRQEAPLPTYTLYTLPWAPPLYSESVAPSHDDFIREFVETYNSRMLERLKRDNAAEDAKHLETTPVVD